MLIQILKSKIQELVVSESSILYPGSIALPLELMKAASIREFELVHVNNKTNGNRITTYAVPSGKPGFVTVNGAASRLFNKGDLIHVLSFAYLDEKESGSFSPILVKTDDSNKIKEAGSYIL
ncbi:MAG: aspartate 1-decarboxylase [Bacteroidia bacterium]|nr:aspartate 1-decarboxylase [Bacteroidia bacterium]